MKDIQDLGEQIAEIEGTIFTLKDELGAITEEYGQDMRDLQQKTIDAFASVKKTLEIQRAYLRYLLIKDEATALYKEYIKMIEKYNK